MGASPGPVIADPTFRTYSPAAATAYLAGREVLQYHLDSPSPSNHTLLDVGCGPGNSTRDLALSFQHAIGADPGEAMIAAAREKGGKAGNGEDVRWVVGPAEQLEAVVEKAREMGWKGEGVDMITAGMAAHWFDMPKFWAQADKVLNNHGTVALWTHSSLYCHPAHPSAAVIQGHLFHLELSALAPFSLPGLDLSRNFYDLLPAPWTITPTVTAFPSSLFVRREWDCDGILSDSRPPEAGADFFSLSREETLEEFERSLCTASMVTRWREAHPKLIGTDRDCVKECTHRIRKVLGESNKVRLGSGTALLLFRKNM